MYGNVKKFGHRTVNVDSGINVDLGASFELKDKLDRVSERAETSSLLSHPGWYVRSLGITRESLWILVVRLGADGERPFIRKSFRLALRSSSTSLYFFFPSIHKWAILRCSLGTICSNWSLSGILVVLSKLASDFKT